MAKKNSTELNYVHQDHISSTSLTTDASGGLAGSISYLPYGLTRASSGTLPAQKFTGQREDDTGLYYYNARYYDPGIGRFISPDTMIPDSKNPQSYNRYSYCINNPLSCIDPSGRDYIFVCGSGGDRSEWDTMIKSLNIDRTKENIYYVDDTLRGFPWEIQDQVSGLEKALTDNDLKDIKIIGHSEGAAATITVLDKIANDSSYLAGTNIRTELKAAITLEAPTSLVSGAVVGGWDSTRYNDLPNRLAKVAPQATLLDVWNTASIVHSSTPMLGWNNNSLSYNSVSFWERVFWFCWKGPGGYVTDNALLQGKFHNDPLTNSKVISKIKSAISS